ncbi:uncharacterized protein JCM15063_005470 [Sporobolomyces koalae]|uniref:uncharacterized protein n=1 Tax=Sporobolomyces koalae TaxID=500713 RepID=UPI00317BAD20
MMRSPFGPRRPSSSSDLTRIDPDDTLPHEPPSSLTSFSSRADVFPQNLSGQSRDEQTGYEPRQDSERWAEGKKAFGPAAGREFLARRQQQLATPLSSMPSIQSHPVESEPRNQETRNVHKSTFVNSPMRRKPVPAVEDETPAPSNSDPAFEIPQTPQPLQLRHNPIMNSIPTLVRPNHENKGPPISGLNANPSVEAVRTRGRTTSQGSTGSVSKDRVLKDLGEAIKRERRKKAIFFDEIEKGKAELKEIEENSIIMREKDKTIEYEQELTIHNLKAEIEELEAELAFADNLDDKTAQEYLSLLSEHSLSHLPLRKSPIDTFDPSLLCSSPTVPAETSRDSTRRPKPSLLGLKRALTTQRRIETRLATHDANYNPDSTQHPYLQDSRDASMSSGGPADKHLGRNGSRQLAGPQPVFPIPTQHRIKNPPPISGLVSTSSLSGNGESRDGFKSMMRKRSNSFMKGLNETTRCFLETM